MRAVDPEIDLQRVHLYLSPESPATLRHSLAVLCGEVHRERLRVPPADARPFQELQELLQRVLTTLSIIQLDSVHRPLLLHWLEVVRTAVVAKLNAIPQDAVLALRPWVEQDVVNTTLRTFTPLPGFVASVCEYMDVGGLVEYYRGPWFAANLATLTALTAPAQFEADRSMDMLMTPPGEMEESRKRGDQEPAEPLKRVRR